MGAAAECEFRCNARGHLRCCRRAALSGTIWHYRLHALRHAMRRQPLLALEANRRFTPPLMRRRGQPWRTRVVAAPVGAGEYSLGPLQLAHSLAHPREGDSSHTAAGGRAEGGGRTPIGRGIGVAQWGGLHGTAQRRPPRRCSACIHCVRQPALQSRVLNEWRSAAEIEARRRSASPSACPVGHCRHAESLAALCVRTETGMLCSG